jgi:hypothetical protein
VAFGTVRCVPCAAAHRCRRDRTATAPALRAELRASVFHISTAKPDVRAPHRDVQIATGERFTALRRGPKLTQFRSPSRRHGGVTDLMTGRIQEEEEGTNSTCSDVTGFHQQSVSRLSEAVGREGLPLRSRARPRTALLKHT